MEIINPEFKARDNNIFVIREKEYENIPEKVTEILQPVTEIGFQIIDVSIKEPRFSSGELSKTIKKTLSVILQKGSSRIDLSLYFPILVDNQHYVINGRKKIALFQLFDFPVVCRKNIVFRSNVTTLQISSLKKNSPVQISFQKRSFPFVTLIACWYGIENLPQRFDLDNIQIDEKPKNEIIATYQKLLLEIRDYYNTHSNDDEDTLLKELGSYFTNYDRLRKGEEILYSVKVIPEIDIFTKRHMKFDNVIDEVLNVMKSGGTRDTNYKNKRIRCLEYVLYIELMRNIYSLCITARNVNEPKFNIKTTKVLEDCNVSNTIQFDFCINPIEELTKLSRTTLIGPGGFEKREHIQAYLKDILPTMFGRICPVDTPDRENCGILQNLIPNTYLNDDLSFSEEFHKKQIISVPVSMVPFLEHDDQTRLQMSSSQTRQAIMLKNFDKSYISSGCESLYSKFTQFVHTAKKDGTVIYYDKYWIVLKYVDETLDLFWISHRHIYTENIDFMNVYISLGDKVCKDQIIAESNYCKNGHITIGKNLLTAVMGYYGDNYEDGIVISDKLVNDDTLTSIHYIDLSFVLPPDKVLLSLCEGSYKPLPDIFEPLAIGSKYAIMKNIPTNPQDFSNIFTDSTELTVKKNVMITDVEVYPNEWNENIPEWNNWINEKIKEQEKHQNQLQDIIFENMSRDEALSFIRIHNLDKFSHTKKYRVKGDLVDGTLIKMFGVYHRKIQIGDKIGNRHGNKGVISRIVEHDKMPQMADGRHVDICINPLGIISRMNIGQLFELHMGMSVHDLKTNLKSMIVSNISQDNIKKYLLDYIKIVDKTENNWYYTQFESQVPEIIDDKFIDELTIIQPPFESVKVDDVKKALEYTNSKFEYPVFEPISKEMVNNEIAIGYMYFFRMIHIAENKVAARGVGTYMKKTMQPTPGRKKHGGQRLGEMETACLIAHDAVKNLHEFFTTKSDCIDLKNKYIRKEIEPDYIDKDNIDIEPESVKLLNSYLTICGIKR